MAEETAGPEKSSLVAQPGRSAIDEVDRTALRPALSDETAVRPSLHVVQDAPAYRQAPSLAETAVRPAVQRVDAAPEEDVRIYAAPRRGHSAWAQTFWVLFVFLLVMAVAGVWLLL